MIIGPLMKLCSWSTYPYILWSSLNKPKSNHIIISINTNTVKINTSPGTCMTHIAEASFTESEASFTLPQSLSVIYAESSLHTGTVFRNLGVSHSIVSRSASVIVKKPPYLYVGELSVESSYFRKPLHSGCISQVRFRLHAKGLWLAWSVNCARVELAQCNGFCSVEIWLYLTTTDCIRLQVNAMATRSMSESRL